ncbi:MAG: pullulanase-type alpha-1,6-glucosidase [Propionibacteriaceae bacterium]|nr:pullulanase-type alpha-1,6-glucosidase [Propionibacteriaceae bacterium]
MAVGADLSGHWLTSTLIAWPPEVPDPKAATWRLLWGAEGGIDPGGSGDWRETPLTYAGPLPEKLAEKHPHLRDYLALRLDADIAAEALLGQVLLSVAGPGCSASSGLQISGVLDDLYADAAHAELGVSWRGETPVLRVWAPTATDVWLTLWDSPATLHEPPGIIPMTRRLDGVWELAGEPDWDGRPYRYRVRVYSPARGAMLVNDVTDPYSVALTINSSHSMIVNPDDQDLRPDAWEHAPTPELEHAVDQVAYELHVRDFSISDKSVPEPLRGSYLAFTVAGNGMAHLRRLAEAGLTSVQLLPVFDNATAEEHPARRNGPSKEQLRALPPDSAEQQRQVLAAGGAAGFAWGYDPWHYMVPEGSFSSTLESGTGRARIAEFRAMVGALHAAGLRVVLDMVFNHTAFGGQNQKSVLDRIVPGYYHRLDRAGYVEESACGANVATEHLMAQKLMVDACVHWVRHYKVDGFRFDLMGHHSRANMLAVRRALDEERPGVTMCGEGWNFGEVAFNARFTQATQGQLGGTGIGTFSDRLRDAVRGGGYQMDIRAQGFGSGLFTADNGHNGPDPRRRLAELTDLIQVGLAGTLRDFTFTSSAQRRMVRGDQVPYGMSPAGYAQEPDEAINYVDVHDNETLFDILSIKLPPATPIQARVRLNTLCLALATLGQSPVLWHAGTDILRSKSFDANSYNSGDWFNYLDFSLTGNGFPGGLPPQPDNGRNWDVLRPLLTNPNLRPGPDDIRLAHAMALDVLRLRASSRLFRLRSAQLVRQLVSFPVSGTDMELPGVIIMRLGGDGLDPAWRALAVIFNATPNTVWQGVPGPTAGFTLHPIQADGADEVVKQARSSGDHFVVPAYTAAVFGLPR